MKQSFKNLLITTAFVLVGCGGSSAATQTIELTYADWGNQELNQRMIDAFMEQYPNINVTLRQDITGNGAEFTGNLVAADLAGILPDVFATDNVPTVITAGLTKDVAPFWDADEDTELVYDNIALTGVYNGKRYALPSFQFLKGIFINLNIFERANLNTVAGKYRIDNDGYPVKDWTFTEMVEIAKAIRNFDLNNSENLVIGLDTWYGSPDFQQVWPTMENAETQYDTWDGEQFNYTSSSWINAMSAKVDLHQLTDGTTTRFTEDDLEENEILVENYFIQTGYAAMDIEGSWQFWVMKEAKETSDLDIGFWPYPRGSEGFFPPTILDYAAVSSKTLYPEEAYLLAKWMTFGQEGWNARLDLLEADREDALDAGEVPAYLDRFPVADYPGVWTRVRALVDGIEGIDSTFDRIAFAKPDLDKWLPGYKDFWAWANNPNTEFNFNNLVLAGSTAVPTYAAEWEAKINTLVQAQLEALGS